MHFTLSTAVIALVAVSAPASAGLITERTTSLCNQPAYGAVGKPWTHGSAPGSFCGKTKPSNSGQWATLPYWDGGDTVKCSTWAKSGLKVCNGGNPTKPLPSTCNPPHNFPVGWAGIPNVGTAKITCKPSAAATCSWWQPWNCFIPSAWRQTCTVTWTPKPAPVIIPSKSSAAVSKSSAATSSVAASSVVPSSAAASSAVASVDPAASSAAASSVVAPASTAPASTTDAPAPSSDIPTSTASSVAPATTTVANVDPTTYPVCQSKYQVAYTNYTIVAPNGYWMGQTVGSAVNDASYMTYTLATNVNDCLAACDQIEGCVFVNTYLDTNAEEADLPKHAPGVYTCAMFSQCVGTDKNDNFGGQDDPNQIYESNGYCKSGACS